MGVYIPNIEKPKDCKECQWHLDFYIEDKQVGGLCTITEKDDKENTYPLIEIDLVRCGECSRRKKNGFCLEHNRYERNDDGFCNYGERRADEHI